MLDQPLYRNMEEISKLQETMQSLLNDQARLNLQSPEREEQEKQHDSQNESRSSSIKATRKALTETIRELAEVYRRQTELCKAEMQKRQLEIDKLEKWAGQRKELERVLKNIPLEPQFAQIKKLDQQYMRLDVCLFPPHLPQQVSDTFYRLRYKKRKNVSYDSKPRDFDSPTLFLTRKASSRRGLPQHPREWKILTAPLTRTSAISNPQAILQPRQKSSFP